MTDTAVAAAADATAPANVHQFTIPGTENVAMAVEIDRIPAAIRMDLLQKGIEGYVRNSVNQAILKYSKAIVTGKQIGSAHV